MNFSRCIVHFFCLNFLFSCSPVLFCIFSCGLVQCPRLYQCLFLVITMVQVLTMAMLITLSAPCHFLHPPAPRLTLPPTRKLLPGHSRLVIGVRTDEYWQSVFGQICFLSTSKKYNYVFCRRITFHKFVALKYS